MSGIKIAPPIIRNAVSVLACASIFFLPQKPGRAPKAHPPANSIKATEDRPMLATNPHFQNCGGKKSGCSLIAVDPARSIRLVFWLSNGMRITIYNKGTIPLTFISASGLKPDHMYILLPKDSPLVPYGMKTGTYIDLGKLSEQRSRFDDPSKP